MSPAFLFAFVLASLYGLGFYVIFGRGWLRLVVYWLVGVLGFFLGQGIAQFVGLGIFNLGEISLFEGTLVSWLCLLAARVWR